MKQDWLDHCLEYAETPGDFRAGTRKIFRNVSLSFFDLESDLQASDVGYKKLKMSLLKKLYIHEDSLSAAVEEWEERVPKRKYGSVGFHCYNHIKKPHSSEKRNKRSSNMGPCMQAVSLTITGDMVAEVDVFYRTTELFKKFPADLVMLRDMMLSRFDFTEIPFSRMTCHFANVSINPSFVTVPMVLWGDYMDWLDQIKHGDPSFYKQCIKWIGIMTREEFIKFKQTRNTAEAFHAHLRPSDRERLYEFTQRELKEISNG